MTEVAQYDCRTKDGITWTALASGTHGRYNFSEPGQLGAFELLGGLAFNFNTSQEAASQVYTNLQDRDWFSMNSAAMIFQWVTYNGNLDMFTYNVVRFGLDETGLMHKRKEAFSLPLNLQAGGGEFYTSRIVIMVNFVLYFGLVCANIFTQVKIWIRGRKDSGSTLGFLQKFFSNVWNFTDTVSLVINIVSIVNFVSYYLMPFRVDYLFSLNVQDKYVVPDADVKRFNMAKAVDPERVIQDDWYVMHMFEQANSAYNMFLTIAAINSFFIAIKVVKYVSQVKDVKPFYTTICEGMSQNIFFMIIIFLLLFGFAVFLNVVLGSVIFEVSTIQGSFITLFYWMLGIFDMKPYLKATRVFSIFFFIIVMLIFYFIATNMFLATMLNKYADLVGDSSKKEREESLRTEKKVRLVEYNPAEDPKVEEDIHARVIDKGGPPGAEKREVRVTWVKPREKPKAGGPVASTEPIEESAASQRGADKAGVEIGDIIIRVNKDSREFKQALLVWDPKGAEETANPNEEAPDEEEGVKANLKRLEADKRTGMISIYFKRPQKATGLISHDDQEEEEDTTFTPTVRNFWKAKGAIVRTEEEIKQQARQEEGANAGQGDEGEESEGEDAAQGATTNHEKEA
jgi:hypothetical protein